MNICIFGVGGVGGYYGSLLAKYLSETGKGRIYFVARGNHKDAIVEQGLLLKKEGGKEELLIRPFLCTDNIDELPECDIVVMAVKGYDLENATKTLSKITADHTMVLPLLNGADIYERMQPHLQKGYLLPACLYLGTHVESPGVVFQKGGSGQIAVGKDPLHPNFYPDKLLQTFSAAGILIEFFEDVNIPIWTKYIFIASFALVTATYDKTIGEVAHDQQLAVLVQAIMKEIESVARALAIELPVDIVATSFSKAGQFPMETKTSFQRDVETKGRQSEWDLFGGTILRYAEKFNLPVENTRSTFETLMKTI